MPVPGSDRRRRDLLATARSISFRLIVAPWLPLQFLQYHTCVMLLGLMLRRVQAHISTMETQQVSMKWEFRTRLRIASKHGDQHIEAMSNVCDGLRGDAFVAAQETGFDNVFWIIDGRPCGIDTLINHMRGMVFPWTEHESKELFRQHCRPGGPLSRQNGESMKQYVSRRRRCSTLPTQMDQ